MPEKSMRSANKRLCCLVAVMCCLAVILPANPALAHRVLVFAFAEGETIHTESKFVGSGAVQKGEVKVQDRKTGMVLLTGTTDENGKFSFKIPPEAVSEQMELLIIVGASMGHQGEWLLKPSSYLSKASLTATVGPEAGSKTGPSAAATGTGVAKDAVTDQQAMEVAMERILERKLAPIKEMLADLSVRRRTLPEIIGGLGYIIGIFGVVAYFMSKKQPKA